MERVKRSARDEEDIHPAPDMEQHGNNAESLKKPRPDESISVPATSPDANLPPKQEKTTSTSTPVTSSSSTMELPLDDGVMPIIAHNCVHERVLPRDGDMSSSTTSTEDSSDRPPAKTYPFKLDTFQETAINCIKKGESVMVSAHTSAGKTVVAEYAIAQALRDNQRVIYTSPIKALSNQKYREFNEEFSDVGLLTGDVTISPNANCLVMTTEILRSMLYRGSEIMREVAWVVFDEIHYLRDIDRGVVWEETLIMLPHKVHYVFLSATTPNAKEFAEWIATLHHQPCNVVTTDFRPVPLQHYIYPSGGNGIHLIMDEHSVFRESNFERAVTGLQPGAGPGVRGQQNPGRDMSDIYKIVKMIMEKNYQPVIAFCFSKRDVEKRALSMSKLDFNTEEEKALVDSVFTNAIDSLSDDDKSLPQIQHLLPLLKRGIGIHHSGLLPLLKEIVEILFQEGLIKVLFATETFSLGLNMPARTVIFTSIRKFDGKERRYITSGEYIQMSGRAGRRGLDTRGIVITMLDEKMEPEEVKNIITGLPNRLDSSFHLCFNMLLNSCRIEGGNIESIIHHSYLQFQAQRCVPRKEKELIEMEGRYHDFRIDDEQAVSQCYLLRSQLEKLKLEYTNTILKPIHCLPYLQTGRLVQINDGTEEWGWGIVVNFLRKSASESTGTTINSTLNYVVDCLLCCDVASLTSRPRPTPKGTKGQLEVLPVSLHCVTAISSIRLYIPKDLRPLPNRMSVLNALLQVNEHFPDGIPLLDPVADMQINDEPFLKLTKRIEVLEDRLQSNPIFSEPKMLQKVLAYHQKMDLKQLIEKQQRDIKSAKGMILNRELKAMRRVLRRMDFLDASSDVITTKGRVACEINSGDELVTTELIFSGLLNDLDVGQLVGVLASLVCEEKGADQITLRSELQGPIKQLQEIANKVAKVSQECKIDIEPDEFVKSYTGTLSEVAYRWANGAKFGELCQVTDIFEGNLVRSLRNLEELVQEIGNCGTVIGAESLVLKLKEASSKIKRDIVFAASLYL
nr:exosome RNA helicase MTR4 [Paratrimastix eleionoma]